MCYDSYCKKNTFFGKEVHNLKKRLSLFLVAVLLISFQFPGASFAKSKNISNEEKEFVGNFEEVKELIENSQLEIDLLNESKVEKKVYNENGKEIGTMGIEEVKTENSPGEIGTLATTLPKDVNKTFKVYWYAATVNYSFYCTVKVSSSTGKGQIVSAYDPWYMVIPPGIVGRDSLAITRKYETSSLPAEAKYTLYMTAPVSTSLWIYGRVQNGKFITGGN